MSLLGVGWRFFALPCIVLRCLAPLGIADIDLHCLAWLGIAQYILAFSVSVLLALQHLALLRILLG
eukprot:360559-Pyramimonas_sp.AAC.1